MKKSILFIGVFLLILGGLAVLAGYIRYANDPVDFSQRGPAWAPEQPAQVVEIPEDSATSTEIAIQSEESVIAETQPYLPPPTTNQTGATLGRQRVPLDDEIASVHKLYYHNPSLTLFMTVTETDGLRSVWKLSEDGKSERVFAAAPNTGDIRIDGDSNGVIYIQHDNPSTLYRSDDGLKTWQVVLRDFGMFWGIADDGLGTLYGAQHDWNSAILYRSLDNGFHWEPWKDFQELFPQYAVRYREGDDRYWLRHLHDVIYDKDRQQIIVGTGDVARFAFMSRDGGKTWKEVWDEGFTSHLKIEGIGRYLLGPDRLHSHGIALYDGETGSAEEVWNPIPHNYAGYAYSMANADGIYYVGLHTESNEVEEIDPVFGIIVSKDGVVWYPFLQWGPLGHNARTNVWLEVGPNIVYASVNGSLYAFRPLTPGWFAGKTPFEAK